jgi:hypothetical protein
MPRREIKPTIHHFATSADVLKNADHHGVTLRVPRDEDVVVARPASRLTEELKRGIQDHKDALIRDLLFRQAIEYLNERYVRGADLSVLHEPEDALEDVWPPEVPLSEFRAALRKYVEAGLAEYKRVKQGV